MSFSSGTTEGQHRINNREVINLTRSRKAVLLSIDDATLKERYMQKLLSLLKNKGVKTVLLSSVPESYSSTLQQLNIQPREALVITNAPKSLLTAQIAGLSAIGLSTAPLSAEFVSPDTYSLYNVLNWELNSHHLSENEQHEPLQKITTLILAAGKGTRLGLEKPKVLTPFAGRTALEIMYNKVKPFSERIIVVPSAEDEKEILEHLEETRLSAEVVIDSLPYGTGGSAAAALGKLQDDETVAIVWGAQIALPQQALKNLISLHQKHDTDLSISTRMRKNPYIHLERDEQGIIQKILRQRWGDVMPSYGENETGFFVFKGRTLRHALSTINRSYLQKRADAPPGAKAAEEFDLLEVIPTLATSNHRVLTASCILDEGKLGFKTQEDIAYHEEKIRKGAVY